MIVVRIGSMFEHTDRASHKWCLLVGHCYTQKQQILHCAWL